MSEVYYFLKLLKYCVYNSWKAVLHYYDANTCVDSIVDFVMSTSKNDLQVIFYWFLTEDKYKAFQKVCQYFGFEVNDIE